jgi:hypothetical protein
MTMHFAHVAFALIAGGAAVLLIAGLVLETLQENEQNLGVFPDAGDATEKAEATEVPAVREANAAEILEDATPFSHSRGDRPRCNKSLGRVEEREPDHPRRKEQHWKEKRNRKEMRNRPEGHEKRNSRTASAETEDA